MRQIAVIGFGEAGATFAQAGGWGPHARAFDLADKAAAYADAHIAGCPDNGQAVRGADIVLGLVTAGQALSAARTSAESITRSTLYCDMNSVAPATKSEAAAAINAAGGSYVDVAIMAPVNPAKLGVPLLLSGPAADAALTALVDLGFTNVRIVGARVGQASAIKMIRSVMVKGVEALTAEMMLGARAAGVADEVLASLGDDWAAKADYHLERMATHGRRRAAEMEEVARTLSALGVDPVMTRGTIVRQREMAA